MTLARGLGRESETDVVDKVIIHTTLETFTFVQVTLPKLHQRKVQTLSNKQHFRDERSSNSVFVMST